ncbi:hypothetical protein [Lutibacter sp.]|uniref:hypothetical protein n=1 Tax=Lutibacter sp. TaxID=1925666 RepID=UPI003564AF4E
MDLRIDVAYYDDVEENLLQKNYPNEFERIDQIVKAGYIKVPFADFKTYSQMHHRNSEYGKLNSFTTIQENIGDLYGNVNVYTGFEIETGRFYTEYPNNNEQNHVSESIGCGGALSVLSQIYGLTQADWQRINIQGHKDFDFDSAVIENFNKMIVVEAKGSIVSDNSLKSNFSYHKSNIKEKKSDEGFKSKYAKGTDLLIGGITVIDKVNHAKIYLVDPPEVSQLDEKFRLKIKILKRLTFYLDWISIISKRAYFTIALKNRVKALEKIDDISKLNFLALVNASNKQLQVSDDFVKSRSNIGGTIIGNLSEIKSKKAVFIGLNMELYNLIMEQDFKGISSYKADSFIGNRRIDIKISGKKAESSEFIRNIDVDYRKGRSELFHFIVEDAIVFQNSAGVIYSIITTKNKYSLPYE